MSRYHPKGWSGPLANQQKGWIAARTHGFSKTPTYRSWAQMIKRCTNSNDKRWKDYGGRGIIVCDRWRTFANFLSDMGVRPAGLTLGRIENDGNYEPGNCRWETPAQQMRNTRRSARIGPYSIAEWEAQLGLYEMLGIPRSTLAMRIARGWTIERAVSKNKLDTRGCNNSSGFPGVWKVWKADNQWKAYLTINGKRVFLGRASTPWEAYLLRVRAAQEHGIALPEKDYFIRGVQAG